MAEPPPRHLPPKKEVALALLEGESVFIHLDPRREGVLVPKTFARQAQLVLQVGLHLAVRIPDLTIDDEGISCTLSFSRSPFWCRMPWAAIYALVGPDGRGMLWPEDVPPEVAEQMRAGRAARGAKAPADAAEPAPDAEARPPTKRPRRKAAKASPEEAPPAERPRPALAAVPQPRPTPPSAPSGRRPADRAWSGPRPLLPRSAPTCGPAAAARPRGRARPVGGPGGSSRPTSAWSSSRRSVRRLPLGLRARVGWGPGRG